MQVAIAEQALHGDPHCGDQCAAWEHGNKITLCVADGLGHGEYAEEAGLAAVAYVGHHLHESLEKIFAGCDSAIRHTRGVAMGIAVIDTETQTLTYGGVNNISMMIIGQQTRHVRCCDGIVGGGYKRFMSEVLPLGNGDLVILHSDGLKELAPLPDAAAAGCPDLQRLAGQLLKDWDRGTDDAAILIYRREE